MHARQLTFDHLYQAQDLLDQAQQQGIVFARTLAGTSMVILWDGAEYEVEVDCDLETVYEPAHERFVDLVQWAYVSL